MRALRLFGLILILFRCHLILAQVQTPAQPAAHTLATPQPSAPAPVPLEREHHHKLVFENAFIRVYDGYVALHDTTPMHIHAANSVVIFLSHSRFGIQLAGGSPVVTEVRPGDWRYADYGDKPVTHIVWDEGPDPFHFYVVELKN